jgi:tetratricopeptide (TPR) repeat protein
MEVVPDLGLLRQSFEGFGRRKRIKYLEALVLQNPAAGNYEELGDLYLDDSKYAKARECFDRVISPRTDSPDPYYRRALAALALNDYQAAVADLEQVVAMDPKYDYHRAAGLLAHTLAQLGRHDEAGARFADVTQTSTLSETQYNYASFLAGVGRGAEAREWARKIIAKKPTMPAYMRRRERQWFRRAAALIKRLPAA